MINRSYLFVPANEREMLAKAWSRGSDALVVDLEDAVPASGKASARDSVAVWLNDQAAEHGEIWVRVNNDRELFAADLDVASAENVTGVIVPKVADAAQAMSIGRAIAIARPDSVPLSWIPLIETARAMVQIHEIAESPLVLTMMIGEYDFAADLGMELTPDGLGMLVHRSRLILACAAADLAPPIAPVHVDFRDLDAYRTATEYFRRFGFVGRAAIHPDQVLLINEIYTPTIEEIDRARELLAIHDLALTEGKGVSIDDEGRMVDEAVVRSARRVLDLGTR